ncbi:GNAT family N-acetyltransferase [Afifella marina]|uniref:Ribosomal protein S18 acetylase RimI n=1 Tax=Afifella marina DSM 2698 TaxID=1120955 RepID=A0A1G5NS15_AFIMA|nr:GNAT family N-acetyltransferase [Afifella marina]SCZ39541.1 Ribosomal protein S18 acetylase RimI [Afifella marina DSM 2698]
MSAVVIDIRYAEHSDATAIADVHERSWSEAYAGILPAVALRQMVARHGPRHWVEVIGRRRNVLVLEVGGVIAGYATFGVARQRSHARTAEIYELYLLPEYQGIGGGRLLFEETCRTLKERGFTRLIVRALTENARALEFYERRGGEIRSMAQTLFGERRMPVAVFSFKL